MLNSTQIPNKILEKVCREGNGFSAGEISAILEVCRATFGHDHIDMNFVGPKYYRNLVRKGAFIRIKKGRKNIFALNPEFWDRSDDTSALSKVEEIPLNNPPNNIYNNNNIINPLIFDKSLNNIPNFAKSEDSDSPKTLILAYKEKFLARISDREPRFNWAQCMTLAKARIKEYGLPRMLELLDAYLDSDDQFYRSQAWSLSCFLATKITNKLNQTTK